ncbi:hypothetical protein CmeUKMEL1_11405 [Cryptosporidium meleagridis]|uniref:F-box domain-containing protein n=1 Tax=Cryptosporidium meleagridis TaxID=93969 RepID=A0A2P4Z2N5_9CRYT|nr:hypothetical protein CmeUKMEL1_11405 [Cryptosporidium meleagridis]
MSRKHSILNNTRIIMKLFSFLEISDLVKMRNLNSCCKLISDHYIKVSIHRDKSKHKSIDIENNYQSISGSNNNNITNNFCSNKINNNSNISQLRMKFLQLWNIYSNKNLIEKVNYYDYNLCFIIKILIYLISNVKDGLDLSLIFATSHFHLQQIYGYGLDDSNSLSSNINNHSKNNNAFNLERDLDLDIEQDEYIDFQSNSSNIGLNHNHESIPIYIQEFFRNEGIWKAIAKLSGYNLSNAELSSESNGIFEYYLWPEKMEDPKYSIIDQNIIENIFSAILKMKTLDPNIRKQITVLMNKNLKAELTFYSNAGNVINRSNINIVKDQFSPSYYNQHCNTDFLRDNCHNINGNYPSEMINPLLQPCTFINSQLSSIILIWIINFLKLQKQLPCLKQITKSDKFVFNTNSNNKYRLQNRNHQLLHNHNYNYNKIPLNSKLSSPKFSKLNNINNQSQNQCSNSNLGDISETFGKLCNIINSQENLLTELKQILNTIK